MRRSPCFWIACSKLQVDQVLENMIPHFPYEVEGVLGNGEVNYRRPPNASLDGQRNLSAGWLVYVDIFTGAVKSGRETEATIRPSSQDPLLEWEVTMQRWLHCHQIIGSFIPKWEYSKKGLPSLVYHHTWPRYEPLCGCIYLLPP